MLHLGHVVLVGEVDARNSVGDGVLAEILIGDGNVALAAEKLFKVDDIFEGDVVQNEVFDSVVI